MVGLLSQFMETKVKQKGIGSSLEFKAGKSPIMTATDVAAHGLSMEIISFKFVKRLERNSCFV
ncbi:hypothetical protein ACE6H2_020303 [Prunus campanulata]